VRQAVIKRMKADIITLFSDWIWSTCSSVLMRIFHRSHEAPTQCRSTPHQHSLCCYSRLHRTFSAVSFAPFPVVFICFYLHPHRLFAFCFLDADVEQISLWCDWTGACHHLADDCGQIRYVHLVRECYSAWWPWIADSGSADRWTEIMLFFGFSQGSVLGLILFLPYAQQIFAIIASFKLSNVLKLNAEKTQLIWIGTG